MSAAYDYTGTMTSKGFRVAFARLCGPGEPRCRISRTGRLFAVASVVCAGGALLCLVSVVHTVEMSIRSGELRHRRWVGPVLLWEQVEPTAFSTLLARGPIQPETASWHMTCRWSLLHPVSPHYRYHSVPDHFELAVKVLQASAMEADELRSVILDAASALEKDNPSAAVQVMYDAATDAVESVTLRGRERNLKSGKLGKSGEE